MWQWKIWNKFITCCRCFHNSRTCTHIHGWYTNLFQRNPRMELESNPKHVFTLLTDPLIHSKQVRHKVNWATAKRVSGTVARIPFPSVKYCNPVITFFKTTFVSLCCFNSSKAVCKMTRRKRKMHSYISIKFFFFYNHSYGQVILLPQKPVWSQEKSWTVKTVWTWMDITSGH